MKRCNHPTCNVLIDRDETYCDKHKTYINKSYNDIRQRNNPEYLKFYKSNAWQTMRMRILMKHDYLCANCNRIAQMVDHIIPTKEDWSKRLDENNLQPLCNECHNIKTQKDLKRK